MNLASMSPRALAMTFILVVGGTWLVVVLPVNFWHRSTLKELTPADVQKITIELRAPVQGQPQEPRVVLTGDEVKEFLRLLAAARSYSPSHPKGGWTRFARIETTKKNYYLPIHASSNNGTLVWLFSGGTGGWNFGTLRNDALEPFVDQVIARAGITNDTAPVAAQPK